MEIKYAVNNPKNGENTLYNTREEAIEAFWANVIALAKSHFHNTAYVVVEKNEDGSETWYNDNGDEIERPKTNEEIAELLAIPNKTPVEVLP